MKEKLKIARFVIEGLMVLAIFILLFWGTEMKKKSDSLQSVVTSLRTEIVHSKSKSGKDVATSPVAEVHKIDLMPNQVETAKDMGIKKKRVKAGATIGFEANGEIVGKPVLFNPTGISFRTDTTHYKYDAVLGTYGFKDNKYIGRTESPRSTFLYVHPIGKINIDSMIMSIPKPPMQFNDCYLTAIDSANVLKYSYIDTTKIIAHIKRKWFLGKETLEISSKLSNPNAKVTTQEAVVVDNSVSKGKIFGAGVGIGAAVVILLILL